MDTMTAGLRQLAERHATMSQPSPRVGEEQHARIARAEQAATLRARADRLREEADALINQAEELERQ